jgi:hypothetical protein
LQAAAASLSPLAPSRVVYLPVGDGGVTTPGKGIYLIDEPLMVPEGVCLRGPTPVNDDAGADAEDAYSAIIKVSAATGTYPWNPGSVPNPAAIVLLPTNYTEAGSVLRRPVVENLWIDGSNLTSATVADGIAATGNVYHALIRNVGVWKSSGNGIAAYPYKPAMGNDYNADAWEIDSCILQGCVGNGVSFFGEDTILQAVHAQTCGKDAFSIQHSNNRLIGCRGDGSQNGFTIDLMVSPSGCVTLIGCGAESNALNGLNVVKSSSSKGANGTVIASGCTFNFPVQAGISVAGSNIVIPQGCSVTASTGVGPTNALVTAAAADGSVPALVQAVGGLWNCLSSTLVSDGGTGDLLSLAIHAVTGGEVGVSGSSAIALYTENPI